MGMEAEGHSLADTGQASVTLDQVPQIAVADARALASKEHRRTGARRSHVEPHAEGESDAIGRDDPLLTAFAVADYQRHPRVVEVVHVEHDQLVRAESAAEEGGEDRPVPLERSGD